MKVGRWFVGAFLGGILGAAVWVAVAYFAEYELGIVAWAIGLLAGYGARILDRHAAGPGPAVIAVLAALLCVGVGKVGTVAALLDQGSRESPDWPLVYLADSLVREAEREGSELTWPEGITPEIAAAESDYPPEIWGEAERRWAAIPLADQERYKQDQGHASLLDREWVISFLADDLVQKYETLGHELDWPENRKEVPMNRDDYPEALWQEATEQWRELSSEEQYAFEENRVAPVLATGGAQPQLLPLTATTLTLWDLLWFGLAAMTAWKVGYGEDDADDELDPDEIQPASA